MDEDGLPYATITVLVLILGVAWLVTGFIPTEESLSGVWWSRETMQDGQWWRLVTSMFAHGGILHLVFNGIALLSMTPLERQLGTTTFALVYLGAGIGGGLAHVMTTTIPAVGASGAIFGLLGIILVLAPRMELGLMGIPIPAIVLLPLYMSAVLFVPALSQVPIAHWAHLGGMFVGMAAGIGLRPRQALIHLVYAGLFFLATSALVSAIQATAWQAWLGQVQTEGLLPALVSIWPVWLPIIGLIVLLEALRREEEQDGSTRTGS